MVFPKSEFQKASVKEADLSKGLLADMFDEIEEKKLNIHSMMLLKDGNRVFRASAYDHDEDTVENVYSVAKSFTSVAIGILSDMNLINLDDYVLFFFSKEVTEFLPGYEKLKIKHLLSMSTGQERDILFEMRPGDNVYSNFFNVPIKYEFGSVFQYHNMNTFMLSAIVTKVTGKSLNDFLNEYLYPYIGIEKPEWQQVGEVTLGASSLMLSANDMARFGLLLLNDGNWNGKQIISKEYLDKATSLQIKTVGEGLNTDTAGYGYQFWVNSFGDFRCPGKFNQLIVINKKYNLVFVTKSYEEREVLDLFTNYILKAADEGWHYVNFSLRDYIRKFKMNSKPIIESEKEKRI